MMQTATAKTNLQQGKWSRNIRNIKKDKALYLLALPGILYFIIFHYLPMYGVLIAFKDYSIYKGFDASQWVGFDNFFKLFGMFGFTRALRNTIIISLMKLILCFPVPIILSLLLNEFRNTTYKKIVQTSIYLPHFVSWVIISGILYAIFSPSTGILKQIADIFNYQGTIINPQTSKEHFRMFLVFTQLWKEAGFGTVLYMATITAIDPSLYEAAYVDGAKKLRQIWHITLPGLRSTIVILLILRVGDILNAGFDQIFVLYNPQVYEVGEILDTYIYTIGIQQAVFSLATASGVFKSVIGLILVVFTNFIAKKIDSNSGLI